MTRLPIWHPSWCHHPSCTAYADFDIVDRYHRTRPMAIETDDPKIGLYVLALMSASDPTDIEIQISEWERPLSEGFYAGQAAEGRELLMPIHTADELRHVIAAVVRVTR